MDIVKFYEDRELTIKKEQVLTFLNQNPPEAWIKIHPYVRNWKYIPIDKVEFMLKKFFKSYRIEVIGYGQLFNAVQCHVRIHFMDLATGEWEYHDGLGASDMQTDANTGNLKLDLSNIKRGAVSMALPIAKTLALKDAADHLGNIFGANLNRKDIQNYKFDNKLNDKPDSNVSPEKKRLIMHLEGCEDLNQIKILKSQCDAQFLTDHEELINTYEAKFSQL